MSSNNSSKEAQAKAEASFKRKADQARDGKVAMAEYEAAGRLMRERTTKLREMRLAKEAAEAAEAAANPKPKPAPKAKAAVKAAPKADAEPKAKAKLAKGKKKGTQ
jgi:hypothetical protein